jgi:hypothetical protein
MHILSNRDKISKQCEWLLYILVTTLVFEGIFRKVLPPLSTLIFFIKDAICCAGIFILNRTRLPPIILSLRSTWSRLFILFLPLLVLTGFKDFILAIFASKQYILYIVVGGLLVISFPVNKEENFRKYLFFISLLLLPTTIIAIIQNSLPASHWLNTSVGGDSLEAFSAAGFLRVGSTFSFTAQYSWFLNAESFFLATSFFMPPNLKSKLWHKFKPIIYALLLLMLAIGAFITGGRTAVLGCGGTLVLGLSLIGIKRPGWVFSQGLLIVSLCLISLIALKAVKPQYFMAYEERSVGTEHTTHNEEMANRVFDGFTEWTNWFWEQDATAILMGNGLGIMSNGANQISNYASEIRATLWTEGDVSTTFWEGGLYLVVIWYGFRLSVILLCYRIWRSINDKILSSAASVPFAYVIIHGVVAQLAMQPPLSIWWWFAIGIIFFIFQVEKHKKMSFRITEPNYHG